MKASDLRIGNLLHSNGVVVTIDGRTIFDIWDDEGLKTYSPIPLTEEWLLKFGFEYDHDGRYEYHGSKFYRYKSRLIVDRGGLFFDYGSDVEIKYAHQLQNLCFALTGEELNFR